MEVINRESRKHSEQRIEPIFDFLSPAEDVLKCNKVGVGLRNRLSNREFADL
jgi:hypothetical protein